MTITVVLKNFGEILLCAQPLFRGVVGGVKVVNAPESPI